MLVVDEEQPIGRGLAALVDRVSGRTDELARLMVARYRSEIAEYSTLDETVLEQDVREISIINTRALLANLGRGEVLRIDELTASREGAARRVHHGISLESLLQAYRLWGQVVWQAILSSARADRHDEREAALTIAGRVFEHVDVLSTTAAQAYLDEAQSLWSEREVVRRDLLDALISGRAASQPAGRQAAALHLELSRDYVVILARGTDPRAEETEGRARRQRVAMRQALEATKRHLLPHAGSLLAGMRYSEVVALYPVEARGDVPAAREQCERLAAALVRPGFKLGVGGWHPGLAGVAAGYAEAREAVGVALRADPDTRLVAFDDMLVDHILRSSPHADRILADALGPLREYDERRGAELLPTLHAYFAAGYNVTRSAARLHVHPNTVVYRLGRIRELTGRDPHDPDDLLVLSLGLKLTDDEPLADAARTPGG